MGWNRRTIRKGEHERKSGIRCVDAFRQRGRKRSEERLPTLLKDLMAVVDGQSQTKPQFRSNRLYICLTATEARRQLLVKFGYGEKQLRTASRDDCSQAKWFVDIPYTVPTGRDN